MFIIFDQNIIKLEANTIWIGMNYTARKLYLAKQYQTEIIVFKYLRNTVKLDKSSTKAYIPSYSIQS